LYLLIGHFFAQRINIALFFLYGAAQLGGGFFKVGFG
jgi:hypothetical protein